MVVYPIIIQISSGWVVEHSVDRTWIAHDRIILVSMFFPRLTTTTAIILISLKRIHSKRTLEFSCWSNQATKSMYIVVRKTSQQYLNWLLYFQQNFCLKDRLNLNNTSFSSTSIRLMKNKASIQVRCKTRLYTKYRRWTSGVGKRKINYFSSSSQSFILIHLSFFAEKSLKNKLHLNFTPAWLLHPIVVNWDLLFSFCNSISLLLPSISILNPRALIGISCTWPTVFPSCVFICPSFPEWILAIASHNFIPSLWMMSSQGDQPHWVVPMPCVVSIV